MKNKWNQWTAINNSIKTKLRQKKIKNQKPNLRRSQFFSPGQNDTRSDVLSQALGCV